MTRQRVIYSVPARTNPWAPYNRKLRRLNWIVAATLVMVVIMLMFMVFASAKPGPWVDFALPLIALPFMFCCLAGMVTGFQLMAFRCPQCRRGFSVTWTSNWPWRRHCAHCGAWRDTLTPPST
jgi:hypothetical protein